MRGKSLNPTRRSGGSKALGKFEPNKGGEESLKPCAGEKFEPNKEGEERKPKA